MNGGLAMLGARNSPIRRWCPRLIGLVVAFYLVSQALAPRWLRSPASLASKLFSDRQDEHYEDLFRGVKRHGPPYTYPHTDPGKRANAVVLVLVRNSEIDGLLLVMDSFETRFNRQYQYPYLFINDEPFTDEFKAAVRRSTRAKVTFDLVPPELWETPKWINLTLAGEKMKELEAQGVLYGGVESYHKMCRFYSGPVFKMRSVRKYDFFWRLDSVGVEYHCDIKFDPFVYLQERNMVYSFTVALHEYSETVPTLWNVTQEYMRSRGDVPATWLNYFTDNGVTYNGHHFWSNFEIADVRFFAGEDYQSYFDYLDKAGGFFYERWGDAPVHSLGLGLWAQKSQVHFFREIGYTHPPYTHCPREPELAQYCDCAHKLVINDAVFSSLNNFLSTAPHKVADAAALAKAAGEKLISQVTTMRVVCTRENEVSEAGTYATCKEVPVPQHCLMYSFMVSGSGLQLDVETHFARHKSCVVHYFNQHMDVETMKKAVKALEDEERYGIYWRQYTLGNADNVWEGKGRDMDANPGNRDFDTNLVNNLRTLSSVRRELWHENTVIDIVKFDLEGDEFSVLENMLDDPDALYNVKYLMFEVHMRQTAIWHQNHKIPAVLDRLMAAGFVLAHADTNPYSTLETIGDRTVPCCVKQVYVNRRFWK